jgi:hypothetical protein
MIKITALLVKAPRKENLPSEKETATRKTAITIERMVVASVESNSFNPILPNTATNAAKTADNKA